MENHPGIILAIRELNATLERRLEPIQRSLQRIEAQLLRAEVGSKPTAIDRVADGLDKVNAAVEVLVNR